MQINSVLTLCTGNICRSPLAEGLLRKRAPALRVSSAGIGAVVGGEMPEAAAEIAERENLPLESHRGKQVTRELLQQHDVVMVMEGGQKRWLVSNFPESRGRIFLLSHWTGNADIADPYRQSADVFERIYQQIEQSVAAWLERLKPAVTQQTDRSG